MLPLLNWISQNQLLSSVIAANSIWFLISLILIIRETSATFSVTMSLLGFLSVNVLIAAIAGVEVAQIILCLAIIIVMLSWFFF